MADWNASHVTSCLLVATTMVLLSFGALVTTYEAAMAVPDWPGTYGHNMFLFPLAQWLGGPWDVFLEHGHRLLGALVGFLTLVVAACVWRWQADPTIRWLAVAAVVLVLVQGGLGGARVLLDDTTVAKVHACTGPLFFAVTVALAVLSSRREAAGTAVAVDTSASPGGRLSAAVPVAAYLQLVAGAQLRHLDPSTPPATFHALVGGHVVVGMLVVGLSIAAIVGTRRARPVVRRWAVVVAGIVAAQFLLGMGTWVARYGVPSAILPEAWRLSEPLVARSLPSAITITAHAVLGMMILGAGVALAILATASRTARLVPEPLAGFRPTRSKVPA